jgi:hypothetical protein
MHNEMDPTEHLDLETVSTHSGASAEMEALSIKGVLEAEGIEAVIIGDAVLPNFPFEVRVARDRVDEARRIVAAAQAAGPAAAEEAERAGEAQP